VNFASTTSPPAGGFANWRAITAWWRDQCGRSGPPSVANIITHAIGADVLELIR
jgi:hypothetical protein